MDLVALFWQFLLQAIAEALAALVVAFGGTL